jgi:hypothetical protein
MRNKTEESGAYCALDPKHPWYYQHLMQHLQDAFMLMDLEATGQMEAFMKHTYQEYLMMNKQYEQLKKNRKAALKSIGVSDHERP